MDSSTFSTNISQSSGAHAPPQPSQEEWFPAGVSNLSMRAQPYEPLNQQGLSTYHPNAPPHRLSHHSSMPASFQQEQGEAEIDAYIHIPCIKKLYEAHCGLSKTVTHLFEVNTELQETVVRLKGEQEQNLRLPEGPTNYAMYRRTVSGRSLAPSDSLSNRLLRQSSGSIEPQEIQGENSPSNLLTPIPQPAKRPDDLPFEVLWQRDDCKQDVLGAQPTKSNSGRPPMQYAIRDKDGSLIDKAHFKAIQKTVKSQVSTLIQDEGERLKGQGLPTKNITKTYFESCRAKQWLHAIAVIEEAHPILTYAAAHWKAEQLLATALTTRRTHDSKKAVNPSKKTKRSTKGNRKEGGGSETTPSSDVDGGQDASEEGDDGGSSAKVSVGSKRKRMSNSTSNPSETPAASDFGQTQVTQPQLDAQDVEIESSEPSIGSVKKRLGKQAAFAAISAAALRISNTQLIQPEATVRPPPKASPLSLISVDATYDGLKDVFSTMFHKNMPPRAIELLNALQKISDSTTLNSSSPSSTVLEFIERIESADPNIPDIDEDDTNIGWGHSQFTAGGLTCRSVLKSWSDIGNVQTAYRLLAASLKTGLVARHLCFVNHIPVSETSSYLSDAYLREVVEILWDFRAQDFVLDPAAAGHALESTAATTAMVEAPAASGSTQNSEPASHKQPPHGNLKRLERLHADELRNWMVDHSIPLPAHNKRKKNDLIATIIQAGGEKIPSEEQISQTISQRTHKRMSAAVAAKPT